MAQIGADGPSPRPAATSTGTAPFPGKHAGMGTTITDPDIAALDRAGALTWPGTETEPLGDWLLRAGAGLTGRANSVLTPGAPGVPLPEAAARIRRWYTTRGLTPMASVSYPAGQPERNPGARFLAD